MPMGFGREQGTTAVSADGRVSGADRYETATKAASSYLTCRGSLGTWNTIVVVSGDNYPDALAAAICYNQNFRI